MREFYVESTQTFVMENETRVLPKKMVRTVRNEQVLIHGLERVVITTDEEVFDWDIAQSNAEILFTKYSVKHGLMTSNEAKCLRAELDVSEKEFAKLVGIPEETIIHIETGSLISNESNKLLQMFKAKCNSVGAMA